MLVRAAEKRNKCYVNKKTVFRTCFKRNLSYCFQKRLGFDISDCSADFGNNDIGIGFLPTLYMKSFISFVIWGIT